MNETAFFPPQLQSQPLIDASVSSEPLSNDHSAAENAEEVEEEEGGKDTLPKSPTAEKNDSVNSDELSTKVKQLSLDSAYTSEADLEKSTSSQASQVESGEDDNAVEEPPPDLNRIVEVRKSPHTQRSAPKYLQKRPANLLHFHSSAPLHSPPPLTAGHYGNGIFYHPTAAAYAPAPYMYGQNPYTPQAAIQTIGPMYHGNHW